MPVRPHTIDPPPDPTPCEAWLYRLSRTTNEWWWKTGGDGTYLVLPVELAVYLLDRHKVDLPSLYIEAVAAALTPLFEKKKAVLEEELRSLVMDRASDRRLVLMQPAESRAVTAKTLATVGEGGSW